MAGSFHVVGVMSGKLREEIRELKLRLRSNSLTMDLYLQLEGVADCSQLCHTLCGKVSTHSLEEDFVDKDVFRAGRRIMKLTELVYKIGHLNHYLS